MEKTDTSYSIDAVSFSPPNPLLSDLGSSLERFLVTPEAEYEKCLLGEDGTLSRGAQEVPNDAYHYAKVNMLSS
jgi:hypothetical protein